MSVTVVSGRDTIEVTKGETWVTEESRLHVLSAEGETVATFRDWQYVARKRVEWDGCPEPRFYFIPQSWDTTAHGDFSREIRRTPSGMLT